MSACLVAGCRRDAVTHSMCRTHFDRWRNTGDARKQRLSRACLTCGRFFETDRRDKAFCSTKCRSRFNYLQRTSLNPPSRDPNPLRPSVWEEFAEPEPEEPASNSLRLFTVADVWAKSVECPVCGEKLDESIDPLSPEAGVPSWLVPLDDGGEPTFDNRIIVHRKCKARQAQGAYARQGWKSRSSHGRKHKKGKAVKHSGS